MSLRWARRAFCWSCRALANITERGQVICLFILYAFLLSLPLGAMAWLGLVIVALPGFFI